MDPATILGLLIAFGALFGMITLEGASVTSVTLPAPMLLVLVGTIAIGVAGSTLKDVVHAAKSLPRAFLAKPPKPGESIEQVVALADKARREGLLSLEAAAAETKDPFLRDALQNIADGTDGEDLRELLDDAVETKIKSDHTASKFFTTLGGYAPTVGIIGTVVSLTHVLENLSNPEELGHMIAAAFVATLWGLLSANFIWLPIGSRLSRLSELEVDRMTLITEGVLAVQAGSQPTLLRERLTAMVPAYRQQGGKKNTRGKAQDRDAA
ncbi:MULTISPECIES: motility protein A [Arthrobacter]|uniref:motility protein A n=1 Tax=unclassified Arthrobacter TaxID=235627 RepID=UPI0024B8E7BB|nr:MotA/TolQ/ExbB proton channel family protein [Arthrobacter sp. H35-MC1]MDJ0316654.1 MotA/TolQ/ExbB proton channel family protein [Arthrobacter sp. H35-MC1]